MADERDFSEEKNVTAAPEEFAQKSSFVPSWYVVHTYSGYENKVKTTIEQTIANRELQDQILEVRVPMLDAIEIKNNAKKLVTKKMFPGYVLLHMVMNETTWYVVRNTRGVTGFVGPGSKPVPLTEAEMRNLGIGEVEYRLDIIEGDRVELVDGTWKGTDGIVESINHKKETVKVLIETMGREIPVEIGFEHVKKM
ncbi:MAG: transcription termination/antitermination protein NusG [Lachnospiraceae bacterium]|nr:transcription termination/antitermination protein NusG [Lachnospiraceae bacterium]MDY5741980.1 transcription termination/antitermination protein NusG [Lachnospiraceae bacterium]